jgi:hypothetical protein
MGRYQSDEEITDLASGAATTEQDADEEPTDEPDAGEDEGEAGDEAPEGEDEESEEQEDEDGEEDPTVAIGGRPRGRVRFRNCARATCEPPTTQDQQLAQLRRQTADAEALRQALERNPQETLKVLARRTKWTSLSLTRRSHARADPPDGTRGEVEHVGAAPARERRGR